MSKRKQPTDTYPAYPESRGEKRRVLPPPIQARDLIKLPKAESEIQCLHHSSFAESRTANWAEFLPDEYDEMSESGGQSDASSEWKLEDSLDEYGIKILETNKLSDEYLEECEEYLHGNLKPSVFPEDQLNEIIEDTRLRLEGYVQRDILPWTVPSIMNLRRMDFESDIEEQMHSVWTIPNMGGTKPMPDYVAGYSIKSLTAEERKKKLPMINKGFLLPFLICEAKSGLEGLLEAQNQNTHAGGIVVAAMFRLYQEAYSDTTEINEKILVWSIDLNHEHANIYGHYGKMEGGFSIYRHRFAQIQLFNEKQRFIPYNFVRNIYTKFAPEHLSRIKRALQNQEATPDEIGLPSTSLSLSRLQTELLAESSTLERLTILYQQLPALEDLWNELGSLQKCHADTMKLVRQEREGRLLQREAMIIEHKLQIEDFEDVITSLREELTRSRKMESGDKIDPDSLFYNFQSFLSQKLTGSKLDNFE